MSQLAAQRELLIEQLKGQKKANRILLLKDSIMAGLIKSGKVKKHQAVIDRLVAQYRNGNS
jgi:hypothetical protein